MTRTKSSRALVSVVLAVLMAVAFMPAISYTSFAATAKKATKVTKVYHTGNKTYTRTVGSAWTLKYKLSPSKLTSAAKKVVWKSSNSKVAKVSTQKGNKAIVSFNKTGSATVTVYTKANKKAKATWKFKVVKPADKTTTLTGVTVSAPNAKDPASELKVGTTLKANVAPEDAAGVTYQWYADGTPIDGATKASFTVTTNEIGKAISVKAKSKNEVESAKTAVVAKETLESVSIATVTTENGKEKVTSGASSPAVGDVLRAVTGANNSAVSTDLATIQWYRVGKAGNLNTVETAIDGATSADYTVTAADKGYTLEVKVTPKANVLGIARTASTGEVATSKNVTVSQKNANAVVGDTLEVTTDPAAASSALTYQWSYKGAKDTGYTAIAGATSATYKADKAGSYQVVVGLSKTETYYTVTGATLTFTVNKAPEATLPDVVAYDATARTNARTAVLAGDTLHAEVPGVGTDIQWYSKDVAGKVTKIATDGQKADYTIPPEAAVGTTYYAELTGKTGTKYAGSKKTSAEFKVTAKKLNVTATLLSTDNKVGTTLTLNGVDTAKIGVDYTIAWTIVDADGNKIADVAGSDNQASITFPANAVGYKIKATVTGIGDYAGQTTSATTNDPIVNA